MGRPKSLTKERVLDAINRWVVEKGIPPTVEELRRILRVGSKQTVVRYLEELNEAGLLERIAGAARGLKPLSPGGDAVATTAVPVVGSAPAGTPMLAEENIEAWVQIPKEMAPPGSRYFLLRVRGDSMNRAKVAGEAIDDGDLILVRQQPTAGAGSVVVALIDEDATIKRLVPKIGYYVLKPESRNPRHRPIVVERDFRIQGVVVRVLKGGATITTKGD